MANKTSPEGSSCTHAICSLRYVVDHYVSYGSSVNICSLDILKAFDKMNHHALFIKFVSLWRHQLNNVTHLFISIKSFPYRDF